MRQEVMLNYSSLNDIDSVFPAIPLASPMTRQPSIQRKIDLPAKSRMRSLIASQERSRKESPAASPLTASKE